MNLFELTCVSLLTKVEGCPSGESPFPLDLNTRKILHSSEYARCNSRPPPEGAGSVTVSESERRDGKGSFCQQCQINVTELKRQALALADPSSLKVCEYMFNFTLSLKAGRIWPVMQSNTFHQFYTKAPYSWSTWIDTTMTLLICALGLFLWILQWHGNNLFFPPPSCNESSEVGLTFIMRHVVMGDQCVFVHLMLCWRNRDRLPWFHSCTAGDIRAQMACSE